MVNAIITVAGFGIAAVLSRGGASAAARMLRARGRSLGELG
jgi:hypothetical protein